MFSYTTIKESYSAKSNPHLTYDASRIDQIILGTLKLMSECILSDSQDPENDDK